MAKPSNRPSRIAGFDVGTSGLKVTLANPTNGSICENRYFRYAAYRELRPGVVPVSVYIDAVETALASLRARYEIVSMAISTQMYSICAREEGELVAYQWNSLWERKPEIEDGIAKHMRLSGCPVDTLFPAYKLASMTEQQRAQFVPYGIKEALLERLTGRRVVDTVTASATGMFDIFARRWNMDFVGSLSLDASALPKAVNHAEAIGKNAESIVAPGLGDGPSASYACKSLSPLCGNLGTSMAARVFTNHALLCEADGLWNFVVDDKTFVTGGVSSNGCSVLNWARNVGLDTDSEIADSGLIQFFPWLHGERMPYWSSDLRGTLIGVSVDDDRRKIAGAVVKAVAFTFARMARVLEAAVGPDFPLVIAGGGTNVEHLLDVIAGCLDSKLALLRDAEYLCSMGASISAGKAIGVDVAPDMEVARVIAPTGRFRAEYEQWAKMGERVCGLYR